MFIASFDNHRSAEYVFDSQRAYFRKKGFVWRAFVLALGNESKGLYEQISNNWNDLDAITGKSVAFVFASEEASTFLHIGNEIQREQYAPPESNFSIGVSNSVLIEKMRELTNIDINSFPCLVFENLINQNGSFLVVPIENDSNIAAIMKYISINTEFYLQEINERKSDIEHGLRRIEVYCDQKTRFMNVCLESKLVNEDELKNLIDDFEREDNSYTDYRLIDLWHYVNATVQKSIYGNRNGELVNQLVKTKREVVNFREKLERYNDLVDEINTLQMSIYDIVRGIDTKNVRDDAIKCIDSGIGEIDLILRNSGIDEEIRKSIRDEIVSMKYGEMKTIKSKMDGLSKKFTSYTIMGIDNIGRIMTVFTIVSKVILWMHMF